MASYRPIPLSQLQGGGGGDGGGLMMTLLVCCISSIISAIVAFFFRKQINKMLRPKPKPPPVRAAPPARAPPPPPRPPPVRAAPVRAVRGFRSRRIKIRRPRFSRKFKKFGRRKAVRKFGRRFGGVRKFGRRFGGVRKIFRRPRFGRRRWCFSPETPIKLQNGVEVAMKDLKLGDVLINGSVVNAVMRILNENDPYYKIHSSELDRDIYVTGSHYVKDGDRYKSVRNFSGAESTTQVDSVVSCLVTSDHKIPVGEYIFWDWEDNLVV